MASNLNRNEIEQMVRNEFALLAKKECDIDGDTPIGKALGIDSLYMLEMYAMIESNFGVMIPTERLQTMKTINNIVDTILEFKQ